MVKNAKILKVYYTSISELESATGNTYKEGDLITDNDILGASDLTWQQIAINSPISDMTFKTEPLTAEQYGEYNRDDISVKGFEAPEGKIVRIHDTSFSTTHAQLLDSGLGSIIPAMGESDTVSTTARDTETVEVTAGTITVSNVGNPLKIGENLVILKAVSGTTLTVAPKINVKSGDTVNDVDYFDLDETKGNPFLLFVETDGGAFLVTWVRFGIDFETPNNDLLRITINFQGDKANKSNLDSSSIGSINTESNTQHLSTTTFKGISIIISNLICANSFNFKLTREMTRIKCQATESQQGNGGTFSSKYTTELTITAYSDVLETPYKNNDYVEIIAQKSNFMIYLPGALVRSEDTNTVNDNMQMTTYVVAGNVDMSKKVKIVL